MNYSKGSQNREMEDEERAMMIAMREKEKEAIGYAQKQLSPIHHHIHFTLQKAYFKCAYECFESNNKNKNKNNKNKKEWVDDCVEYCTVPVLKAHYLADHEVALFQDRLKESMKVCQDKFEVAKNLQNNKTVAMDELESCVDQSVKESIETLPHVVERLNRFLSID